MEALTNVIEENNEKKNITIQEWWWQGSMRDSEASTGASLN